MLDIKVVDNYVYIGSDNKICLCFGNNEEAHEFVIKFLKSKNI